MNSWLHLIRRIIETGVEKGEIKPEASADEIATIIIATLEGAIMMSKLYGDSIHMHRVINHLNQYLETHL
jgi:TetR/AcrR family transcriptional regulator, transcriptional repressor for nem operon